MYCLNKKIHYLITFITNNERITEIKKKKKNENNGIIDINKNNIQAKALDKCIMM